MAENERPKTTVELYDWEIKHLLTALNKYYGEVIDEWCVDCETAKAKLEQALKETSK